MELDQLKEMWGNMATDKKISSDEEIQAMLRKKSKSPIAKLKHNLFCEMLVVVVLYSFTIVYYFLKFEGAILSVAWMMLIAGLLYMFYYFRKRKLLNDMECVACEVKSNLQQQLQVLEKYIRLYLVIGTLLFPVILLFAGVIIFLYDSSIKHAPDSISFWKFFLILFVITTIMTIPVYYINKWYVRRLYGQHADKLKAILHEMSEEENQLNHEKN